MPKEVIGQKFTTEDIRRALKLAGEWKGDNRPKPVVTTPLVQKAAEMVGNDEEKQRTLAFGNMAECILNVDTYMEQCEKSGKMPTLAGFSKYCKTSLVLLRRLEEDFPDAFCYMMAAFEDATFQVNKQQSSLLILKNTFGYKEKNETDLKTSVEVIVDESQRKYLE